uniref:Uncharacterized protein n=1 Tax=Rhizophora mucronata TaxID=61149 RepID=A0A2P2LKD7_RHIMU
MDPEQTFIRVQERFSQMLTPKVRAALEYIYLIIAITLFAILVVMHANYVQQPGCSSELSGIEATGAQLIQIKITSAGLWSQNESELNAIDAPDGRTLTATLELPNGGGYGFSFLAAKFWFSWIGLNARKSKLALKFWKTDNDLLEHQYESSSNTESSKRLVDDSLGKTKKGERQTSFPLSAKETLKAAATHFGKKFRRRLSFVWSQTMQIIRALWKLWVS